MKLFAYLPLLAVMVSPATLGAGERAATYEAALARAKETGQDILVYQHGSDWNHLGERLLADLWNKDACPGAITNAILVSVDMPEAPGGIPVSLNCPENATPGAQAPASSPGQQLRELIGPKAPLPDCDLTKVDSDQGATFTRLPDGSLLASGKNPGTDTLTLTLKPQRAGSVLRLDFLLDDSLPGRGPGRSSNGNFALSEAQAPGFRFIAAWASASEGQWGAWQAIDGVADKADNLWNPQANQHQQRTLLLVLDKPAPAGVEFTVRLVCKAQWGQHVPGRLRAAVLPEPAIAGNVRAVAQAEIESVHNAKFTWRGATVPRVALLDSQGRPIASEDKPRLGLTPAALGARVAAMQSVRARRDALWKQADTQTGPAKAELLLKGLVTLENEVAFDAAYKPIQEQIRQADPKDESGCVRRLQFQPDPRSTPQLVTDALKLLPDKKYEEALARLDAELQNPGNRWLDHEQLQRIMIGKFHVYRQWPGHEARRFDVQRDIHKLDPTTFWGLGAIGYLAIFDQLPEPVALVYGWNHVHVKGGVNVWNLNLDMDRHFDHAGKYLIRVLHSGGKDTAKIHRLALMDGEVVLAEATPDAPLAPGGKVEANLELKTWPVAGQFSFRVELEADPGKTDVNGRFEVEPLL